MVVQGKIGSEEAQQYYDATDRIRLTPGWPYAGPLKPILANATMSSRAQEMTAAPRRKPIFSPGIGLRNFNHEI